MATMRVTFLMKVAIKTKHANLYTFFPRIFLLPAFLDKRRNDVYTNYIKIKQIMPVREVNCMFLKPNHPYMKPNC